MVGIAQTGTQRGPLELTDEFVEHSQVVEATLDILYDGDIKSFADDKLYHHVIEFARKYDIPIILKTISNQLRVHATLPDKSHCLRLLRVAIDLGECDLMTAIVRATCGHVWPKITESDDDDFFSSSSLFNRISARPHESSGPTINREFESLFPAKKLDPSPPILSKASKEYITGGKAFDLGSWPYPEFAALPPPIAWALLLADQLAAKEYSHLRSDAFERELQNVLVSMCESRSLSSYICR